MTLRDTAEQVRADELGDVARARSISDLVDGPRLRDATVLEHDDAIREGDRIEQIVRDQDPSTRERRQMGAKIATQLDAGADVECRERLVEQQEPRLRSPSRAPSATRCC